MSTHLDQLYQTAFRLSGAVKTQAADVSRGLTGAWAAVTDYVNEQGAPLVRSIPYMTDVQWRIGGRTLRITGVALAASSQLTGGIPYAIARDINSDDVVYIVGAVSKTIPATYALPAAVALIQTGSDGVVEIVIAVGDAVKESIEELDKLSASLMPVLQPISTAILLVSVAAVLFGSWLLLKR